jgi:hypothetical protein
MKESERREQNLRRDNVRIGWTVRILAGAD